MIEFSLKKTELYFDKSLKYMKLFKINVKFCKKIYIT